MQMVVPSKKFACAVQAKNKQVTILHEVTATVSL